MKRLFWVLLILIAIIITSLSLWKISNSRTYQAFGEIYPRVNTSEKCVALSFDDGPTEKTEEILAVLNSLNVKATFFVTGEGLENNMIEGQKIVAAGHELGNHTYSHAPMVLKSYGYVQKEIEETDLLIREAGYKGDILFRPPYAKKLFVLPYYLNENHRKCILWDVEPDSYPEVANSSEKITQHVLENTKPGSIILLHIMFENRSESMEAVEGIVTGLRQQGYTFKTVSELLKS